MKYNTFVMRQSKSKAATFAVLALLSIGLAVLDLFGAAAISFRLFGVFTLPFAIILLLFSLFAMINSIFWTCTVRGNEIHLRTLRRRKTFTFQDIAKVESTYESKRRSLFAGIHLFDSKSQKLLFLSEDGTGFDTFMKRLKSRNVPGADFQRIEDLGKL